MKKFIYLSLATLLALMGCSKEQNAPEIPFAKKTTSIMISVVNTRATIDDSGEGATFAWEDGDNIGVEVTNSEGTHRLAQFEYQGIVDGKAKFMAELEEGETLVNDGFVAYPFVKEDGTNFELTFPAEYTVSKPNDFRLRWAGTLTKEEDGSYTASLEHQTAILRIKYEIVPASAAAVQITIDDASPVKVKFTQPEDDYIDSFYFPVAVSECQKIVVDLIDGSGNVIAAAKKTLSKKNGTLKFTVGEIFKAPVIKLDIYDLVMDDSQFTAGDYVIALRDGTTYKLFSFTKAMENAEKAAEDLTDVHGLSELLAHASASYLTVLNKNYVEIEAEENAESIILPSDAQEAVFSVTSDAPGKGKATLSTEKYTLKVDQVVASLKDNGSAQIFAQFNAPDLVSIAKTLRGTSIPVTFETLIQFAVAEAEKEHISFSDDQVDRLRTGFDHLCRLAKETIEENEKISQILGGNTLMTITTQTPVLDVFSRYYDNAATLSLQLYEKNPQTSIGPFGWSAPIGFYLADDGFTFNVPMPESGWFNYLENSLKGTKQDCINYWADFDGKYDIFGIENFFMRAARKAVNTLSDSTFAMLNEMANAGKFSAIGNVYNNYVNRLNDPLADVYVYKKVVVE